MISLSSLDLSFLRKNDPSACRPGRYVIEGGECVPKRARPPSAHRSDLPTPYFVPDVDAAYGGAWKSIVDGSEISSRSNWREHNKRNEVVDVGDKFWCGDAGDTADNLIEKTETKMGYDPSLVGNSETFSWGKN